MTNIQKILNEKGLEQTVIDLKLKYKDYGDKIMLKYDMLNSDLSLTEVQECRGIILRKKDFSIVSRSFDKFFNIQENNAVNLDWSKSVVLEKLDGSLISLYYDKELSKWCVSTTGTAEAESPVDTTMEVSSFFELTQLTIQKMGLYDFWDKINNYKNVTFMFELTTPYNIVVYPHTEFKLTLLGARNIETSLEYNRDSLNEFSTVLGIPLVKSFNLSNVDEITATFDKIEQYDEGYVVLEETYTSNGSFKRVKIKNPSYVSLHHIKSGVSSVYNLFDVIKQGEFDEFVSYFPDKKNEMEFMKQNYEVFVDIVISRVDDILKSNEYVSFSKENPETRKKFAQKVFELTKDIPIASSILFKVLDENFNCIETYVKEKIQSMDTKKLYNFVFQKKE